MSQVIIKRKGVTLADVIDELLEINVIGYGHDSSLIADRKGTNAAARIQIAPNWQKEKLSMLC